MKRPLRFLRANRTESQRGQSLVEIAIFLPIFILLIAGVAEMGWYLNRYLNLLDASREAARNAADRDPIGTGVADDFNAAYNRKFNHNSPGYDPGALIDCNATTETYSAIACYVQDNLPDELDPENGYDDIVISAFTIRGGAVYSNCRWPDRMDGTSDKGWSLTGWQTSLFPTSRVNEIVADNSPDQGMIIIEVFYMHRQVLGIPFFTAFVPRDLGIHVYTIMPNPTAGTAAVTPVCP